MPAARHGPELILAILQAISGNRSPATDGVFANHIGLSTRFAPGPAQSQKDGIHNDKPVRFRDSSIP
jgi:hypothetical protein